MARCPEAPLAFLHHFCSLHGQPAVLRFSRFELPVGGEPCRSVVAHLLPWMQRMTVRPRFVHIQAKNDCFASSGKVVGLTPFG